MVAPEATDLDSMEQSLQGEGYALLRAANRDETMKLLTTQDVQIVLISTDLKTGNGLDLAQYIRKTRRDPPPQILLLAPGGDGPELHKAIQAGSDDFIKKPFEAAELQARARAAQIRWQNQANLVKEREFYRIAVAEEERLSSLVLDQNRSLKEAYDKIRRLNEELEQANKELEQIAAFDSLSGLLNRRSLFTRISIEIERSIRLNVPLTGLMIDIDHFKSINDNHGHPCGDMVIHEIGTRLLGGLRKYDYAGRYGGEEFFVVLSNSTEQQGLAIADRFRHEMESLQLDCSGEPIRLTVSIGVARYNTGESQDSWIERADRAMYTAKQAGRNRTISSE